MLLARQGGVGTHSHRLLYSSSSSSSALKHRACICQAKRGRPRTTAEDDILEATEPEPAPAKRKGRKKKTEVVPAPTEAEVPLENELQPVEDHERVVSYEMDITSSIELDYIDNPSLIVPSYTHQAQGHESATQPPLDNFVPDYEGSGFVGNEEIPLQQERQEQQPEAAAAAADFEQLEQQPEQQQPQQLLGMQVMQQPQLVGASGVEAAGEEDDDELLGIEEPPGLFDYEAGLAYAVTEPPPEQPLTYLPEHLRAQNRREADYMIRYINWLGTQERLDRQNNYIERALAFHHAQVKEGENIYLTGKALAVVTAEIELEDAQSGNRKDSFYPVWARAEHRWYPSGRFAAYNQYVKENLAELTVKYAPGADQQEDFDIMDDVLLMADDPNMPGGGAEDEVDEGLGGPAAGLSLDSFMGPGLLPGAASSELGQAYLEDVLAPGADEELLEEELE